MACGVVILLWSAVVAHGAVRDVEGMPNFAQLGAAVATVPPARREPLQRVLALVQRGEDVDALAHVAALAGRQPALAAELHESLAGAYLRERRLYRATQHVDAIPAARRSDQAQYLAANIAARQQRLESAMALLEALATRLPDDPLVARDEAQIASLLGRHGQAAAACGRLLKQRPGDAEATLLLARARIAQGRIADGERLLAGLVARAPGNGRAALQLGLAQLALGKPQASRESFVRSRAIGSGNALPYVAEGAVALLAGDRPGARAAAAGALKHNPADPLAALLDVLSRPLPWPAPAHGGSRFLAAVAYPDLESEPLVAAVRDELARPEAGGRIVAANLLLEQLSPAAALTWLESESGGKGGPLAAMTIVRAQVAAGRLQAADAGLAALEVSTTAAGLVGPSVQKAVLAAGRNDRAAARAAMAEAVRRSPDSPRVRVLAGDLYLTLGEPVRAAPEYRKALAKWPRDPRLLNQLAYALAQVGPRREREAALGYAEEALRLQPNYLLRAALLDTRADLLLRLGRSDEALRAYRELSTTVGGMTSPEQWHRLAELAQRAGEVALARKACEEALDHGRDYPGRAADVRWLDGSPDAPPRK